MSGDILLHLMDRIHRERLNEVIKSLSDLTEADVSTIALAIEEKADRVTLDDRAAVKAAKLIADVCSFRVTGTGNLIDEGLEKGFISKSDYERFVEVIGLQPMQRDGTATGALQCNLKPLNRSGIVGDGD